MMDSKSGNSVDNETVLMFLIGGVALVFLLAFFGSGALVVGSAFGVIILLSLFAKSLRAAFIGLIIIFLIFAGLSHVENWDYNWIWQIPFELWKAAWVNKDNTDYLMKLFDWWGTYFLEDGAMPTRQTLVGFCYGAIFYVLWKVREAFQLDSPEKQYRDQKREQKKASAGGDGPIKVSTRKMDKAFNKAHDATVLGAARGNKFVILPDKFANTHTLVVGTTGSGKTVTVLNLVESFIDRGLPVLYVDGKGDRALGERITAFANQQGRGGRLFSMVGESISYNPLSSGSYTSKKDRLIELREWSEPHYRKLAEGYLQMVFKVLEAINIRPGLLNLTEYLTRPQLVQAVRDAVEAETIEEDQAKALIGEIDEQEKAEREVEGIEAEIRNLARSELGRLFSDDGLNIGASLKAGLTVYMGLSPLSYPALATTLGRLIVNDFKASLDPSQAHKMLVVFDEFGVFAGDQVLNVINQGRSAGICAVLTVQSVSDIGKAIERNADHFIEQVFSNCNNFLIHRVNSADNAEKLASIIGTKLTHALTAQLGGDGATGMGSVRQTREFMVHPDKIKQLRTGEAIYLSRNDGSVTEMKARKGEIA